MNFKNSLLDLEDMISSCRSMESRQYIREAVNCYKSSAYRATIVNSWIALVFDIVDKIKELALSGDKNAKNMLDTFTNQQQQIQNGDINGFKRALEFERTILDEVHTKLQLIDNQQKIDLLRLRDDRNRCAHPSFHSDDQPYIPSAEQARMHLRNVIVHVLSQKPIQGKSAINQFREVICSGLFRKEIESICKQLEHYGGRNLNIHTLKKIVDEIIFGYCTQVSDPSNSSPYYLNQNSIHALRGFLEIRKDDIEEHVLSRFEKILHDANSDEIFNSIILILHFPYLYPSISDAMQERIEEYFISNSTEEVLIDSFELMIKVNKLKEILHNKIQQSSSESFKARFLEENIQDETLSIIKNKVLNFYSEAESYYHANDMANKLILPIASMLSNDESFQLIKMIRDNSQLYGSNYALTVLNILLDNNKITLEQIIDILGENCYLSENLLRIHAKQV